MQDSTFTLQGHPQVPGRHGDVFAADCPTRQLLDRIGDKWSVLILILLGTNDLRHNALKRGVQGISQKMLSQTLRSLERDGLVTRHVRPSVPIEVEYRITPLGRGLLDALRLMVDWAEARMPEVAAAQAAYDRR